MWKNQMWTLKVSSLGCILMESWYRVVSWWSYDQAVRELCRSLDWNVRELWWYGNQAPIPLTIFWSNSTRNSTSLRNAFAHVIFSWLQPNSAHVMSVILSWCVQNFNVIGWAHFKPEHRKFWWNSIKILLVGRVPGLNCDGVVIISMKVW